MSARTFGWIQDAGKLSNLKTILKDFVKFESMGTVESQDSISESLGIGRWANETYLRFAEALGFIEYDREYDEFIISDLGKQLSLSTSEDEYQILCDALLSYPPACRILELLKNSKEPLSKFEIAENLGFTNESGFTTYGLNNYIKAYDAAEDKAKIKSNKESTLDKYARMIAGYLVELGWADKTTKQLIYEEYEAFTPHAYFITDSGIQAYGRSLGSSTKTKVIKNVSYEMLASRKQAGSNLLRKRRSLILEYLNKKRGKAVKFETIEQYLSNNESEILKDEFISDVAKLQNIGLQIEKIGSEVILKEKINLNFPIFKTHSQEIKQEIRDIVDEVKSITTTLDDAFVERIVEEAFSGQERCKEFEDSVFELYSEILGFEGIKLGGVGSREPDSLFWYKAQESSDSYGLIVDAKAYSKGFKINTNASRQMNDYVYKYTKELQDKHNINRSHYLWVTSKYSGKNEVEEFAKNIKNMYTFESCGSLISIFNSLLIADKMKKDGDLKQLEPIFTLGREILREDVEKL